MRVVAHNGARIVGGAERATIRLLSGLQSRGHDVLLLCNDPAVAAHAEGSGVPARVAIIGQASIPFGMASIRHLTNGARLFGALHDLDLARFVAYPNLGPRRALKPANQLEHRSFSSTDGVAAPPSRAIETFSAVAG